MQTGCSPRDVECTYVQPYLLIMRSVTSCCAAWRSSDAMVPGDEYASHPSSVKNRRLSAASSRKIV